MIFSKAVFEHIRKERILELFEKCKYALTNGGILIVEVPNMDWIYASHERYMDFTHEVGFNKDSLGQIARSVFGNCELYFSDDSIRHRGLKGKIARTIFSWLICNSESYIDETSLFKRSIISVCRK